MVLLACQEPTPSTWIAGKHINKTEEMRLPKEGERELRLYYFCLETSAKIYSVTTVALQV